MPEEKKATVPRLADVIHEDFCEVVKKLNKGRTAAELSLSLELLTKAVREVGKQGTLTLKITVEPATPSSKGDDVTQVFVTGEVNVREPAPTVPSTLFYTTDHNTLVRQDPRQDEFPEQAGFPKEGRE